MSDELFLTLLFAIFPILLIGGIRETYNLFKELFQEKKEIRRARTIKIQDGRMRGYITLS